MSAKHVKPADPLEAIADAIHACTDGEGSSLDSLDSRIALALHYVQLSADDLSETRADTAGAQQGLANLLLEVQTDVDRLSTALTDISNQVWALQHPDDPSLGLDRLTGGAA